MKATVCLGLVAIAMAAVLQEPRPITNWDVIGRADSGKKIQVLFSLKTNNQMAAALEDIAYPSSKNFRKWFSMTEANAMRRAASPKAVHEWLSGNGIVHWTTVDAVTAEMTVAQAESLFATTISSVKSRRTTEVWHHAGTLHAPENVTSTIEAVFGLHGLPIPPRTPKSRKNGFGADIAIGPVQLRARYNVTGRPSGNVSIRQAVAEFQGEFANDNDQKLFFQKLVPFAKAGDEKVYAYKGNKGSGDGIEALLDIQYIMGVASGLKTEFWGWKNDDFCKDLKNWTTAILNDADPPLVFSISYGWQGDLSELGCTNAEVQSIDTDFQTIAGRGVSIIFASGDSGSECDDNICYPSWPASSPYVTAVGSTCFTNSKMHTEMATTEFGSGSGFSSMFTVGSWQRQTVQAYLQSQSASALPPTSWWSKGGRATADVSALGEGFQVYVDGSIEDVGGTSASAPTFSAIISLLNDLASQAGKPSLGFLNPWIYANPSMFNDVTKGDDLIDRGGSPLQYGFQTAPGWDPPTGFGTPNFAAMSQA